jgi:hypothetical protein
VIDESHEADPLELFDWLPVLALALGRKEISPQQASVALFVALSTKGTTGERGTVDLDRLELELGIGRRQLWRHFRAVCDRGWLQQTVWPTRGSGGERGRRARYRLTHPRLEVSHDSVHDRVPDTSAPKTHDDVSVSESCVTLPPNRVSLSSDSCDVAEREDGTVTPADGSTADGSPTPDHSSSVTTGRASDLRPNRADAVAAIVAKFAPVVSEEQAITAVERIDAWALGRKDPVHDMVAFTASRSIEELQRWFATNRPTTSAAPKRLRCRTGALIASDGACCDACDTTSNRQAS